MTTTTDQHQRGYISDKDRHLKRLRGIEGQARGVSRVIDEEQLCIGIHTQVSALTSALQSVAVGLVDGHLRHGVRDAAAQGGLIADERMREVSAAFARLVR